MKPTEPNVFYNLNQAARATGLPRSLVARAVLSGSISPDAFSGDARYPLFLASRINQIHRIAIRRTLGRAMAQGFSTPRNLKR